LIADRKTGTAVLSVASNTLLIVFKVVVGILIGSVAVLSEAIHSGIDLVAAIIALVAVRVSGHEADEGHPYGHGKVENISGTIEALLIFAAAAWIIYEAVHKLLSPEAIDVPAWGVGVMLLSAVANLFVSRRLFKVGKETDSIALQADGWHLRTDVYTSLGVMAGLLVIWVVGMVSPETDVRWLDPVVAIVVALMILKAAWDLTRASARDLLDASLPEGDVGWICRYVCETWPAVRSFHHLRTRKAGSYRFIDFHLVVDDHMSVGEAHALGDEIVLAIKQRLPDSRVQIHMEPCDFDCPVSCASGCEVPEGEREAQKAERIAHREELERLHAPKETGREWKTDVES
jgi:cation diffusion facilitator family transporter